MSLLLLSSKPPFLHYHHHQQRQQRRRRHLSSPPKTLIPTLTPLYYYYYYNHSKPPLLNPPICATSSSSSSSSSDSVPQSAIQRIADKLRSLGFSEDSHLPPPNDPNPTGRAGEIFVPSPREIPVYRVGSTLDPSWSTPLNPVPLPGSGAAVVRINELRKVVKRGRRQVWNKEDKEEDKDVPTLAELTLKTSELRRLRTLGIRTKEKMKLGKAGITEGVINAIHERWRSSEVVKLVCGDINKLNMKRTHDLLERKTGGMVVWRAGSKIILYRGLTYKFPYFSLDEDDTPLKTISGDAVKFDGIEEGQESNSSQRHVIESPQQSLPRIPGQPSLIPGVGVQSRVRLELPGERELVEEADRLLEGLGPRFADWWGCEPLPVDADLLPAVVPGFRKPFRLLPYGVKPTLTNDEMTILKRLGRPLPCHFALGRNRKHQGLAEAILKLWEKCEIAKIAIKRGVQNTNSELMAEELKSLTGGLLLSRDKDYIVLYRGKDFLPAVASSAIRERRKSRMGEEAQLGNVSPTTESTNSRFNSEGHSSSCINETNKNQKPVYGFQERKTRSIEADIEKTNRKLSMALDEKARSENLLNKLEQEEISRHAEIDKEGITDEEKYMLRKVGLKMKPFLLLGRRGVFDGTIENMHLHWKYRELVKIICGGWNIDEIHNVARTLEAESGGILVAVECVRKGHAIIVYRGKNYQRPESLRPQTLLSKKQALKRSIEAQRRQSLKLNVLKLSKNIKDLKLKLVEDKEALDGQAGHPLSIQSEVEDSQLSAASDDNNDCPKGCGSSVQVKLSSSPESSHHSVNITDNSLVLTDDKLEREHTSLIINSSISDESEASCSEIVLLASGDSGKVSCDESLSNSTSYELDPSAAVHKRINLKDETMKLAQEQEYKALAPPTLGKTKEGNAHAVPAIAKVLTNKERLLLRRQALKMKRRPVLAIGRSNVVTGVAKAIKDHFKKHPLAIVNVKGRAKGTSVKELVFQLEQETGAILVSQEPSKVILYRGWGAGVEKGTFGSSKDNHDTQAYKASLSVSPELMAAMRIECGLSSS